MQDILAGFHPFGFLPARCAAWMQALPAPPTLTVIQIHCLVGFPFDQQLHCIGCFVVSLQHELLIGLGESGQHPAGQPDEQAPSDLRRAEGQPTSGLIPIPETASGLTAVPETDGRQALPPFRCGAFQIRNKESSPCVQLLPA